MSEPQTLIDERFCITVTTPWNRTTTHGIFAIPLPNGQTLKEFSTPVYYSADGQKIKTRLSARVTPKDPFEKTPFESLRAIAHVMLASTQQPAALNVYNNIVRVTEAGTAYFPDMMIEGDLNDLVGQITEIEFYIRIIVINDTKHLVAKATYTRGFYLINARHNLKRRTAAKERHANKAMRSMGATG